MRTRSRKPPTIYDVTDISFPVTSAGGETAAVTALLSVQNAMQFTGSYYFQVFINRLVPTPALDACRAFDQLQDMQISSISLPFALPPFSQTLPPFSQTLPPFSQTPFSENAFQRPPFSQTSPPFSQTTDPRDPSISNSTFYIAPQVVAGDVARAAEPAGRGKLVEQLATRRARRSCGWRALKRLVARRVTARAGLPTS